MTIQRTYQARLIQIIHNGRPGILKESIPPIRKEDRTNKIEAHIIGRQLERVFQPFLSQSTPTEETEIEQRLEAPHELSPPRDRFTINEIKRTIKNNLHSNKPHDMISLQNALYKNSRAWNW